MSSIIDVGKPLFFKAEKYNYHTQHIFDASDSPRPHFCMGLILEGRGIFTDCIHGQEISVSAGDIIFVPISSRYISKWYGEPQITYISIHFIFDSNAAISERKRFLLQKIKVSDFDALEKSFSYIYQNFSGNEFEQLSTLAKIYEIFAKIFPLLKAEEHQTLDTRIAIATNHIEQNYYEELSIDTLAQKCNMSLPRFYPKFKEQTGLTPTEYINRFRISRAIILLLDENNTIEYISEQVGFVSSAYFRRVFKKITGKSPRQYRKTSMEI